MILISYSSIHACLWRSCRLLRMRFYADLSTMHVTWFTKICEWLHNFSRSFVFKVVIFFSRSNFFLYLPTNLSKIHITIRKRGSFFYLKKKKTDNPLLFFISISALRHNKTVSYSSNLLDWFHFSIVIHPWLIRIPQLS